MPSFEYAVKVIAGRSNGEVAAPGEYWTAVNVHNPGPRTVEFGQKLAVALPHRRPGPIRPFIPCVLRPDEALEIDRQDILEQAEMGDFVKGFAVIIANAQLDVVAVYTAAPDERGVSTIEIERVQPRLLRPVLRATRKTAARRRSRR